MKGCESVTEVSNPSPSVRFICRNHERADVKKFLGVKHYNPHKDEDRQVRFDNCAFERSARIQGPDRDGEQEDREISTGVIGIPFDEA
jgi:hypothetical protein